jgi:hypothetical protein
MLHPLVQFGCNLGADMVTKYGYRGFNGQGNSSFICIFGLSVTTYRCWT